MKPREIPSKEFRDRRDHRHSILFWGQQVVCLVEFTVESLWFTVHVGEQVVCLA